MKLSRYGFLGLGLCIGMFANSAAANENAPKRERRAQQKTEIKVAVWGPTQADVDAAKLRVERSPAVQEKLAGTKYRLLELSYLETENKTQATQPPTRFQVVFYDYTNDRTLVAEADFAGAEAVKVRQESYQPNPNPEEYAEALRILGSDSRLGAALRGERTSTFEPMPPVTVLEGTNERLVNVGVRGFNGSDSDEIVGVSIRRGVVIRYGQDAPRESLGAAGGDSCGIPNANQGSTGRGVAGQYQLAVTEGGSPLWDMLVIRPSASSGTKASGLEIRDVKYKGKSVLKRGHLPILNVQYVNNACGPYRDWQYAEDFFAVPTTGVTYPNGTTGGIALLGEGQVATTSMETGTDVGNFRGVAIYKQGNETVLVTEMTADWYRYIMEWRFASDGTIRPRFGFGATNSGCVCNVHTHHAFWRFDFDVVNPENKVFQVERGRKFLQPQTTEFTRLKSLQTNRSLLIQNTRGDEAYMFVPNKTDGVADSYGKSDMWVLRYKNVPGGNAFANELDDGYTAVGGGLATAININPFINGESLVDQDVVVWYGAHFVHADGSNLLNPERSPLILSGTHVVGPDIRPVRW